MKNAREMVAATQDGLKNQRILAQKERDRLRRELKAREAKIESLFTDSMKYLEKAMDREAALGKSKATWGWGANEGRTAPWKSPITECWKEVSEKVAASLKENGFRVQTYENEARLQVSW